ncbi:MAG TPA: vanadium-dependent haloperoxidase [Gaiellaceae bacterium]
MSTRRLLVLAISVFALLPPGTARADTVTDWNAHASNALMTVAAQAPTVSTIHMAMVHGAVYDAVNAIDRSHRHYLYFTNRVLPKASKDAAAATAAYRVLVSIVPAQQPALEPLYQASLAAIPDSSAKTAGIQYGEESAAAMIAARKNDGRFGPPGFPTNVGPGQWRPVLPAFANDPAGWVRNVRPFLVPDGAQFGTSGPYALTSAAYAADFNEVKSVGSLASATRTAAQTNSARYWAENPPRTWGRIIRMLSAQQLLSLTSNARLYAMAYTAAADSLISVWVDKARWGFWRPITAIREAESDGNPATAADTGWEPLLATPPYPEQPSGHLGLSGAIVTTLQLFLGTDSVSWTDTNAGGQTKSYTSLSSALTDIVGARIWSGIHFRKADEDSVNIARKVVAYREANFFGSGR